MTAVLPGATKTPMVEQIMREEGGDYPRALPAEEVIRQVLELLIPYDQTRTGEAVRVDPH